MSEAMNLQLPRSERPRRRPSWLVLLCLAFLAVFLLSAALGHLIAPQQSIGQNLEVGLSSPSFDHILGTDNLGRDILHLLVRGALPALAGPALVAIGSALLGGTLGILSGFLGGWVDAITMRWVDVMYALPGLLVLIVVAGVAGGGARIAVALLILFNAPYTARIIRGATLEQRGLPYVEAARVLGVSRTRRMVSHIFPNVLPQLVATTFLQYATALLALSSLSFLGLGAAPGSADWGLMAADNRTLLFQNPASMLAPAALIVLAASSMNIVGDWLFEAIGKNGQSR